MSTQSLNLFGDASKQVLFSNRVIARESISTNILESNSASVVNLSVTGSLNVGAIDIVNVVADTTFAANQLVATDSTKTLMSFPYSSSAMPNTIVLRDSSGGITISSLTLTNLIVSTLTVTNTSNQLVFGSGNTVTLSASTPAASRIYTIPDVGTNTDFVMTAGTQTITGTKTFNQSIVLSGASNQLVLGVGNTVTLNAVSPSASRIYTFPDIVSCDIVLTDGVQTITGAKTFSNTLTSTATLNQFVLGSATTITLTAPTPAASVTYTILDAGANASFVMSESAQTLNGAMTFSSAVRITSSTNQLILRSGNTVTINATNPSTNRIYSLQDVGANADFVMTFGSQTIAGTKTFTSPITFASANAIIFNPALAGTTLTFTAPSYAANRTIQIPDPKADCFFVPSNRNAVTQLTSITTAVTSNGPSGVITTVTATTAAGATSTFTVNDSYTVATNVVLVDLHQYSGTYLTNGIPYVTVTAVAAASFDVSITNIHGTNALNGTLVIHFLVL